MEKLEAVYHHLKADTVSYQKCLTEIAALREQTTHLPDTVASYGPINYLAATGSAGKEAREARALLGLH